MTPALQDRLSRALGSRVLDSRPLTGGCIAETTKIVTADGRAYVVKRSSPGSQVDGLPIPTMADEAAMLSVLRRTGAVPVPDVAFVEPDLLVMAFVVHDDGPKANSPADGSADLADRLAALHGVTAPRFGFDRPTPIGPLQRPNDWTDDWRDFLRDRRLLFLGRLAAGAGRLPDGCFGRLERLCSRLADWIPATPPASLIHGDLWIGNILFRDGQVAALIDPAVFYADAELELAFLTLFAGVGDGFFARYGEKRPIDPLFFEERRCLYQLEPLLAHAWFFGGGYGTRVDRTLKRFVG